MNTKKMQYLANTIWHKYVLASHVYTQPEYMGEYAGHELLEIQIKIPAHTFKSADYGFGFEIVATICFDQYDGEDFQKFILDPVSYLDNLNELGALNIDSVLAHGFEMEF